MTLRGIPRVLTLIQLAQQNISNPQPLGDEELRNVPRGMKEDPEAH
jgi:hypothetical protein